MISIRVSGRFQLALGLGSGCRVLGEVRVSATLRYCWVRVRFGLVLC